MDPFLQYLGLHRGASAHELLDLPPGEYRAAEIDRALHRRLSQVFSSAGSHDADAGEVRRALRDAAAELRAQAPTNGGAGGARPRREPEQRPQIQLTDFDRQVISVLVGCGGWNAQSRMLLINLARSYGVSPAGLVKVVTGLSDYAKAGGAPLGVSEITGRPARPSSTGSSAAMSTIGRNIDRIGETGEAIIDKYAPEITEQSTWGTIKLSVLIGLITLLVGVLIIQPHLPQHWFAAGRDVPPSQAGPAGVGDAEDAERARRGRDDRRAAEEDRDATRRGPARFATWPSWRSRAIPDEAHHAADTVEATIEELDRIGRRLLVSDEAAESLFQSWRVAAQDLGAAWVLLDTDPCERGQQKIEQALLAASDRPSISDRLLRILGEQAEPPSRRSAYVDEPLRLWRGAWSAGTLAALVTARDMPPVITSRAESLLADALGPGSRGRDGMFRDAASAWLQRAADGLADETAQHEHVSDAWECWIRAVHRLHTGEPRQQALAQGLQALLSSSRTHEPEAHATRVLARLIESLDWRDSPAVRDRFLGMIEAENIDPAALWILTSLLEHYDGAPWYRDDLVIPPEASPSTRRRFAQDIRDQWPGLDTARQRLARGSAIAVDPVSGERWRDLVHRLEQAGIGYEPVDLTRRLVLTARLNEAAALLAGQRTGRADRLMNEIVEALEAGPGSAGQPSTTNPQGRRGQAGGPAIEPDGQWASDYEAARRDVDARLDLIQQLHRAGGRDLGPRDAAAFVRAAYRDPAPEVRDQARRVLVDRFRRGAMIAVTMVDYLPEAPRTPDVAELIERFSGGRLPDPRAAEWSHEARLALVEHALALQPGPSRALDDLAEHLARSYAGRRSAVRGSEDERYETRDPAEVAERLAEAHFEIARQRDVAVEVPAPLMDLHRRHQVRQRLADGPAQSFVANQVSALEALAFLVAAEQPRLAPEIRGIVEDASRTRRQSDLVYDQALITERQIARLWLHRLDLPAAESTDETARTPAPDHAGCLAGHEPRAVGALPRAAMASLAGRVTLHLTAAPAAPMAEARLTDDAGRWEERLTSLHPDDPQGYFELAEEIADSARSSAERDLAAHLFKLAAVLDRARLGPSAALALAELETERQAQRRYRVLAAMLQQRRGPSVLDAAAVARRFSADAEPVAVLDLAEALGHYRQGRFSRAASSLRNEAAMALLEALGDAVPGGLDRFLADLEGGGRPSRGPLEIRRAMPFVQLEHALLVGEQRRWSSDEALLHGRPLIEVDPDRLEETLGVDGSRPIYRRGRWMPLHG